VVVEKRPERCLNGGAAGAGSWRVVVDFEKRSRSLSEVDIRHPFTHTTREAHSTAGLPSEVCLTSVSIVVIRRTGMVRYPKMT
jgi:hypothetical protein